MVFLFSLILSSLAKASAFDYGQQHILALRELRDFAVNPIEFKHDLELHRLQEARLTLEKERIACATFDCASAVRERMRPVDADLAVAELARGEEIAAAELPYEEKAREILLDTYFLTLTENLAADPEVQHFHTRGVGPCGALDSLKGFHYRALAAPHHCRQLVLDFKYREKFVRLTLAVGTASKHFSWDGVYQPVYSSLGISEVERMLETPGWLARYASVDQLGADSRKKVSYYGNGRYMLGGIHDIGIAVVSREER